MPPSLIFFWATAAHNYRLSNWILCQVSVGSRCNVARLVEIMSLSEKEVRRWFDVVQTWHGANSAEDCSNTAKGLNKLSSFLKDLERAITEAVWNKLKPKKFPFNLPYWGFDMAPQF